MRRIPLRRRDGSVRAYALVDDADYEWLTLWRWSLSTAGYARRHYWRDGKCYEVFMHKTIVGNPRVQVDHRNLNRLDNRRNNLRLASPALNSQNLPPYGGSSRFRGVTRHRSGRWQAQVKLNGRSHYLGLFDREKDAARTAAEFRRQHMPFCREAA